MRMPITTTFFRHGKSENNEAIALAKAGTPHPMEKALKKDHTSRTRLHATGIEQAQKLGAWLFEDLSQRARVFCYTDTFANTQFFSSPYIRSIETALETGLPVRWKLDNLLCERNWGLVDYHTYDEHLEIFKREICRQKIDALFWAPRDGESLLDVQVRLLHFFAMLKQEHHQSHVYIGTHGEVMWPARCLLEHWLPSELADRMLKDSEDLPNRMANCRVIQYSRQISDDSSELSDEICRVRLVNTKNPTDPSTNLDWQPIKPREFDQDQLRAYVDQFPCYL